MSLLPRTAEEFSSADYWERFFHYNSLCGVLHKYFKPLSSSSSSFFLLYFLFIMKYHPETFERLKNVYNQTLLSKATYNWGIHKAILLKEANRHRKWLYVFFEDQLVYIYIYIYIYILFFINIFLFLVPQGCESDWLYGSAEGRTQLASSAKFRRLVISMQAVQSELSPVVMELAPPGMPANQQVPFLSVGGDLGWREVIGRGVSALTGEYSVEDVSGEDGHLYRSVWSLLLASSAHKKKKKKSKPSVSEVPALTDAKDRIADRGFLCCTHHEVMVAGLAMLGMDAINNKDHPMSVLLVGLGSGGLPQFVHDFVPFARVEVVELDPAVLEVAQSWFGFQTDERLKVILGDGLEHIKTLESKGGHSFDVIMFDVDSKDTTLGMSCPPSAFVETSLLKKVYSLLTPRGLFMLNLVCRDSALRKSVLKRVQVVFPCVFSRRIEGEVNEVLLCCRSAGEGHKPHSIPQTLQQTARDLQKTLRANTQTAPCVPQIDITAMLNDLKVI
uniref:Methyltransferase like 13 n=1 Tax=Sinocyclocheilus grahami TaxID=75366 RepID=A0A672PZ71_SINGR